MGQSITQSELLDRIEREASQSDGGRCGCTLVIGSGFSFPIVPTTPRIVREDLPWFIWCQRAEKHGPSASDFADDQRRSEMAKEAKAFAVEFWQRVKSWADQYAVQNGQFLSFNLADDGMPDRAGVANAYMAAFSTACPHGLSTDEMARRFLADVIKRGGKRLNPAHLYLASLLGERPKLFRTIFTTNFDPLLQRALQLVNVPYFVSDRPDVMQHPDDDGEVDALHIVHVHGSIYRYLLLNTPDDIESFAVRNQALLQEYFRKHAVLIVGYGGWDDAISRALAKVDRFTKNLYWCDLGASPEQSGISNRGRELLKTRSSAFYVPIKGADDLLVHLHQRLVGHTLPRLFRDPISVVEDQFDQCDLAGIMVPRVRDNAPEARESTSEDSGPNSGSGRQSATPDELDLGDQVQRIRQRLHEAKQVMRGAKAAPHDALLQSLIAKATDLYFGSNPAEAMPSIEAILASPSLSPAERALWLFRRGCTHGSEGRTQDEIEDYTGVVNLAGAPAEQVAKALVNRGVTLGKAGRIEEAVADCTAVINLAGASAEQVANALVNRGVTLSKARRIEEAVADYTAAINLVGAPGEQVALALFNRGVMHGDSGRIDEAVADYTAAIDIPGASAEQVAMALVNRGLMHREANRKEDEITDYTAAINIPGASAEQVANALVSRGVAHNNSGRIEDAVADFTAAINLAGAPAEQVALALFNRGVVYGKVGLSELEIADYTAAINLPGAPAERVASALVNRGVAHGNAGRSKPAVADFIAAINLAGASAEQVGKALFNRGIAHSKAGRAEEEIADYTAVIKLPGACAEQVAMALVNRGITHSKAGQREEAVADYTAAINLPGAPEGVVNRAKELLKKPSKR